MVEIFQSRGDPSIAVLASKAALNVDAALKNLKEAFLLTKCITAGSVEYADINDGLLLVLAYGDATVAEVGLAMSLNSDTAIDFEAVDDHRSQQQAVRRIIAFVALPAGGAGSAVNGMMAFTVRWELPKGGSPFTKGDGPQIFLYNHGSGAISSGATMTCITKWWGVRM